ncbi:MAG: response regulator transcription factor [Dehalococcoidales bacterium]
MNALIIEDDANVVEAVTLCLQLRWPEVDISVAVEGIEGIKMSKLVPFDITILDINLPDIGGFEVLKQVRSFSSMPIIILTVRGEEDDQARGLEMGADDYVIKPFRPRDLIARVNAVLRRSRISMEVTELPSLTRGNFTLNLGNNNFRIGEDTVKLTPTESKLLYALMKNAGTTLSNNEILQEVWGKESVNPEILRTHIRRLRDKIKDKPPSIILNQRGIGYRFASPG